MIAVIERTTIAHWLNYLVRNLTKSRVL